MDAGNGNTINLVVMEQAKTQGRLLLLGPDPVIKTLLLPDTESYDIHSLKYQKYRIHQWNGKSLRCVSLPFFVHKIILRTTRSLSFFSPLCSRSTRLHTFSSVFLLLHWDGRQRPDDLCTLVTPYLNRSYIPSP